MGMFFRLISIQNSNLNKLAKIYFLIKKKDPNSNKIRPPMNKLDTRVKLDPRCNKLDL